MVERRGLAVDLPLELGGQECASFNSQCLRNIGILHYPNLCLVTSEAKPEKRGKEGRSLTTQSHLVMKKICSIFEV
jgi:hypothetical protein